jgi:hypothetical protein
MGNRVRDIISEVDFKQSLLCIQLSEVSIGKVCCVFNCNEKWWDTLYFISEVDLKQSLLRIQLQGEIFVKFIT